MDQNETEALQEAGLALCVVVYAHLRSDKSKVPLSEGLMVTPDTTQGDIKPTSVVASECCVDIN